MTASLSVKENRHTFIGGSDCAAVLGMSRWKSPLQVWGEKTGQVVPEDISDKLAVKLGNRLEEVVAELFTERTGKKVHKVNEPYTHKTHPFLACHIDRKVDGESAILQCKTVSAWKAKEWDDEEIPHEYILQEVHELACTGYDRAYIAVLIGNQDFKWKTVERDPFLISDVTSREANFWNNFVVTKVMPSIIRKDDSETLLKLFPKASIGDVAQIGERADILVDSILNMGQDYKNLDNLINQQKNELRALIGRAESGEGIKWLITNKNQPNGRLDTAKLKADLPDVYKKYKDSKSKTRVLRFKTKEV